MRIRKIHRGASNLPSTRKSKIDQGSLHIVVSGNVARRILELLVPVGPMPHTEANGPRVPHLRTTLRPWISVIDKIIQEDAGLPKRLQTTAMHIMQILRQKHGYTGGYSMVQEYVRQARNPEIALQYARHTPKSGPMKRPKRLGATPAPPETQPTKLAFVEARPVFASHSFRWSSFPQPRRERGERAEEWMRSVLQGAIPIDQMKDEIAGISLEELQALMAATIQAKLSTRNRAVAILSYLRGISPKTICPFLQISQGSLFRHLRLFRRGGSKELFQRKTRKDKKSNQDTNRAAVFTVLHSPPSSHDINRTSWRMADLEHVLSREGHPMGSKTIQTIIQEAGWKWKHARFALTSNDPDYRAKVDAIKGILAQLKPDEAFFSIDEYGPFAIKKKGGVKRIGPGEQYIVPQWQRSKGWAILTAALELSRNQVTHFYSQKKNTDEMVKMADLLREQYRHCRTIYLSWDAASWHVSKSLFAHLELLNEKAGEQGFPVVKTAPLPAGAQFLNVIESVFSGMARAIIHHSDYPSVEAAKDSIDRYFVERNTHFLEHPKRAGQKIWGKELVPSIFAEENNCKDPLYQYPFG